MFILREINEKEDIEDWISLVSHSNIVTAIDQFFDDEISFKHFQIVEKNNAGNMYGKIQTLINGSAYKEIQDKEK